MSTARLSLLAFLLFLLGTCSNFSVTRANTVPPFLVSLTRKADNSGYILRTRAANPEFIFQGYRLYVADTSQDSRNPPDLASGIACSEGTFLANLPIEYNFDVSGDDRVRQDGTICKLRVNLRPGQFVTMRSVIISIRPDQSLSGVAFSQASNTLIVP